MPLSRRLLPHAWIAALLLALSLLVWTNGQRIGRIESLAQLSGTVPAIDVTSPTGYAGGVRMLLAPGHNNESYQWIAQTQQMLATGTWRMRNADYDNAPIGRAVTTPSPYRWWLAAVAWGDHQLTGRPIGLSVEKAAMWADPLLLMIFLIGGTILAAARFGSLAAAVFPLAGATLFPFGGAFLPGCPDDVGLTLVLVAASMLTLLAGILTSPSGAARPKLWFIVSGVFGGLGLWLNVSTVVPVLIGLGASALIGSWLTRRIPAVALPWQTWGLAGATTTLAAWVIEYAPAHLGLSAWRLNEVHAFYALAWLGAGELLVLSHQWLRGTSPFARRADLVRFSCAMLAVAAVPAIMLIKGNAGFLTENNFAARLTALGENVSAKNLAVWLVQEGLTWRLLAVGLPLLLVFAAGAQLWRRDTGPLHRHAAGFVLGPVLATLVLACSQLSWWNTLDALLLVLLVTLTARISGVEPAKPFSLWRCMALAGVLLPGLISLQPARNSTSGPADFTRLELEGLVERDFAHWLARRTGPDGAIVLAPPNLAASLYFHGGLRGLGSPYGENEEGFRASVRLAAAIHADEAQALARQRKLTHIIIPSWDGFLDEYARLGTDHPEQSLMGMINTWLPPRWLKPVPYYLPKGFEDDRLLVFEMTEVQDHASSLSRLTEYFIDMSQVELATLAAKTLATDYGADLGAQVALARTALARRDREERARTIQTILAGLAGDANDSLAWDRRVSLCLVLAADNRMPLARAQVERCLEEMGELDLRGLSEATLFRFLGLCKVLSLQIQDEGLRELSQTLLSPERRTQI